MLSGFGGGCCGGLGIVVCRSLRRRIFWVWRGRRRGRGGGGGSGGGRSGLRLWRRRLGRGGLGGAWLLDIITITGILGRWEVRGEEVGKRKGRWKVEVSRMLHRPYLSSPLSYSYIDQDLML